MKDVKLNLELTNTALGILSNNAFNKSSNGRIPIENLILTKDIGKGKVISCRVLIQSPEEDLVLLSKEKTVTEIGVVLPNVDFTEVPFDGYTKGRLKERVVIEKLTDCVLVALKQKIKVEESAQLNYHGICLDNSTPQASNIAELVFVYSVQDRVRFNELNSTDESAEEDEHSNIPELQWESATAILQQIYGLSTFSTRIINS